MPVSVCVAHRCCLWSDVSKRFILNATHKNTQVGKGRSCKTASQDHFWRDRRRRRRHCFSSFPTEPGAGDGAELPVTGSDCLYAGAPALQERKEVRPLA